MPRGGDSAGFWRAPEPQVLGGGGFLQLLLLLPRHETRLVKVVVGRAHAAPEAFAAEAVFSDPGYIIWNQKGAGAFFFLAGWRTRRESIEGSYGR